MEISATGIMGKKVNQNCRRGFHTPKKALHDIIFIPQVLPSCLSLAKWV